MKKIRIKDTTNEMSTTGTGASFTSGQGEQYASPKAFKIKRSKKKEGINSPFDHASPSIPNRPSKAIDYKKLFQEKKKYNPITDPTSASDDAGFNDGIDMDTLDAASVLEMSKTASPEDAEKELGKPKSGFKVGDVSISPDGTSKSTIYKIDDETGQISWRIDQLPGYDKLFDELADVTATARRTAQKSKDDLKFKEFYEEIRLIRNKIRTHIRKEHPEIYSRIQMRSENINEARYSQFKKQTEVTTPTQQIHRAVREIRRKIDEITKVVGHTERMKTELKSSNEGMSYLKRTKNAISKISEKIQQLNNRIKGLTE